MISIWEGSISNRGATLSSWVATPASGCDAALAASVFGAVEVENLLAARLLVCIADRCDAALVKERSARTPAFRENIVWALPF